jgi:carbamoyl-phosphate synthase large subunit
LLNKSKLLDAVKSIVWELKLNGPFNVQVLAKDNQIKIIECNSRASRSFPFVSKVLRTNLAQIATDVITGQAGVPETIALSPCSFVGVKSSVFSFTRLEGADPVSGVEMVSTGEVGCIADTFQNAFLLSLISSGIRIPKRGILLSTGPVDKKDKLLPSLRGLQKLNLPIYGTEGTAKHLRSHDFKIIEVQWPDTTENNLLSALNIIREGKVDLVINIPKNTTPIELSRGKEIRQTTVRHGCSLITNLEKAAKFLEALSDSKEFLATHEAVPLNSPPKSVIPPSAGKDVRDLDLA